MNSKVVLKIKDRFKVHPLLFQRSLERAKNETELFDILSDMPAHPLVWDEQQRRWKTCDILQFDKLAEIK